jgi:hypothetical protein
MAARCGLRSRRQRQPWRLAEGSQLDHPLGDAVETFVRSEDAERFIEAVCGDDPEPAGYLRPSCVSLAASFGSSARLPVWREGTTRRRVSTATSPTVADAWGGNTQSHGGRTSALPSPESTALISDDGPELASYLRIEERGE